MGGPEQVVRVLEVIHRERPDLRLHGFGVKRTSLAHSAVRELLTTADSMAWSYNARKNGRNNHDWREAKAFAQAVEGIMDRPIGSWQMSLAL